MRSVFYYIGKEMKYYLLDPRALFLSLLFPLILTLLVVYVYPPQGEEETRDFTFGLVSSEDMEGLSWEVISYWEEGLQEPPFLNLTGEDALKKLKAEEIQGFLLIPEDFSSRFYEGSQTYLEVYTNPHDVPGRQAALRVTQSLASQISYLQNIIRAVQYQGDVSAEEILDQIRGDYGLGGIPSLVRPAVINFQNVGPVIPVNRVNWALPAFFTMFCFLAVVLSSVDFVREREQHILERLFIVGTSPGALLTAKFISNVLKGTIQAVILWGTGIVFFNLYLGHSLLPLVWISISFIAAASAFALLVACRSTGPSQAFNCGVLVSLVMAALGGCWWPQYLMPPWMIFIGRITPHYWANEAFYHVLYSSAEFSVIAPGVLVLLLITAGLFLYSFRNCDLV